MDNATTGKPNRLRRQLSRLDILPAGLRRFICQWLMRHSVPFTGTAKISVEQIEAERVILRLRNRRRVQNHFAGVHASATALLAETASGLALAMHIPDDKLPLLKSMTIHYTQRAKGGLIAEAFLDETQRSAVQNEERGEATIRTVVRDDADGIPVECEMTWAWVPKKGASAEN